MHRRPVSAGTGVATKTFYGAAVFFAAFLLLMMIGNHTGHVEDIWLVAFAVGVLVIAARGWWMSRGKWS